MATLLIRNGHVIDPAQSLDGPVDLLIEDGLIRQAAPSISPAGVDRVVEARGLTVIPGLVDMHVHLRDPGLTEKEDIHTGCNAAVIGGITSLLCMPNTKPPADSRETIRYIRERAATAKAKVYVCAAATKGLEGRQLGDYAMYREEGAAAVSDDGRPVESLRMMEEAVRSAKENGLRIVSHCEDLRLIGRGLIHLGEVSQELGLPGMDRRSEDSITQRDLEIAGRLNAPVHICHVSTRGSVELIRAAKAKGWPVTAETCPHYFAYTDEKLRSRDADYRMNPPLREQEDVDAVIQGLQDGTLDCIATDHAPHTRQDKKDFLTAPNGVIGLETSLAAGIRFLVEPGLLTMYQLVQRMSANPARILGIPAGSLAPGMPADLALVDTKAVWTVLPERLQSKSKNSVFKFERLQGKVKYTFVNGELVYVMRY